MNNQTYANAVEVALNKAIGGYKQSWRGEPHNRLFRKRGKHPMTIGMFDNQTFYVMYGFGTFEAEAVERQNTQTGPLIEYSTIEKLVEGVTRYIAANG